MTDYEEEERGNIYSDIYEFIELSTASLAERISIAEAKTTAPGIFTGRISKNRRDKNYSTRYSRVVPHHSTDRAITSLTSQIGRDAVRYGVYGRSCNFHD